MVIIHTIIIVIIIIVIMLVIVIHETMVTLNIVCRSVAV